MGAERVDLDAIEARARAAMDGPWFFEDLSHDPDVYRWSVTARPGEHRFHAGTGVDMATAQHIAGMDPPTVLALIAELRDARPVVEAARAYRALMQQPGSRDLTGPWTALCAALDRHADPSTHQAGSAP